MAPLLMRRGVCMGAAGVVVDVRVAALITKGKELAKGCQYPRYRILAVPSAPEAPNALTTF
jgi:hypothetical protein